MKKTLAITLCLMIVTIAFSVSAADYKIAWYAPMVHPYFDAVKKGVEAFEKDMGIEVMKQIGQEWTQDNQNQNIEALAAKGYKAFSVYPVDAGATNGLYEELTDQGMYAVSFGTSTLLPTTASFAVATDVKDAAMVATEKLIELMGGKGNILNVLEVVEDANTILRKEGIEEVVAKYPDVKIIQEVAGINTVEEGVEKIQNAVSAQLNEIDGIVTTGYVITVAATTILSELHDSGAKKIRFVGIDDDPLVLDAIRDGKIDATIAQNPYGHGYITCTLLKYLLDGWKPKGDAYFVNAGIAVVTKENVETYFDDILAVTKGIVDSLDEEYLTK
jgi:ribose transport system substrate-binding protein